MVDSVSPLDFINPWDFVLVGAGVLVRFLFIMNAKQNEYGDDFTFSKYFDAQHVIRWSFHIIVSFTAILVIPQLFINVIAPRYFEEVHNWAFFGSAFVGFLGYDIIRYIEKISLSKLKKAGLNSSK